MNICTLYIINQSTVSNIENMSMGNNGNGTDWFSIFIIEIPDATFQPYDTIIKNEQLEKTTTHVPQISCLSHIEQIDDFYYNSNYLSVVDNLHYAT